MNRVALFIALACAGQANGQNSFINGITHEGMNVTCDLPNSQQIENIGSKIASKDNRGRKYYAGMCVCTSIEMAALHAGLEQMRGFRDWVAARYEGGGWPEKVDQLLDDYFKAKKIKPITYLQYEGKDPGRILKACDRNGWVAATTYGCSPRYPNAIQHMVCNVMYNGQYAVVLDNNWIGEDSLEWVKCKEMDRRAIYPNQSAWIFMWVSPGPPPSPRNIIVKKEAP